MFYKIYKKKNISSFLAIRQFAKKMGIEKIGHCGTLDPLATGLLIVATNQDTKLLDYISSQSKGYTVTAKLHFSSASYDEVEEITALTKKEITLPKLKKAIEEIAKTTSQIPPIFSSKKINGIRSYELARKNKSVQLKPSSIKIHKLKLLSFNFKKQEFKLRCEVSKGTYIRSLIHDIGVLLETDAIVTKLNRHKVGNITYKQKKYKKITNLKRLFDVLLYKLNFEQLSKIYKQKQVFLGDKKNTNSNYLFLYKKEIIAYGHIKFGEVNLSKVFYSRIERILKMSKQDIK
ncbi:tRNA pseudouridine(55) synthase TruB [Metamycoplasma hyosynoviae]|uniref:tRNA pseudouridine(55) synthase TruB n=1 Tax=Metamycoplasma hyosynoviae TaxID=29559 RepID=UPI002365A774|nr:tRNA pseudouridine(55) synthase TruB [Metamycoplasma hyosynoviae]MDD7896314.1 tRNA pseudouridine(55) synthase TruB [Metamycoplasma hyosynoviae]